MYNVGSGIDVFEDCGRTNLLCNRMENCYYGVNFDQAGINNKLPDQGDITTQTAWKNKWVNNVSLQDRIGGGNLFTPLFWLYTTSDPDYEPITQISSILPLSCNNEITFCDPPQFIDEQKRERAFGYVVGDSIIDDPDSLEFKYNDKEMFFYSVKADNSLLFLGTPNDIKYQNEFDSLSQTNIGKYDKVKVDLQNQDYQLALQKLSAIVDENLKEEKLKYINSVILAGYDPHLDSDSDTIVTLNSIAHLHPFYGGEAVYMARAILHLIIEDQLPQLRRKNKHLTLQAISVRGSLYPNPANNEVVFSLKHSSNDIVLIEVFDVFGKEMAKYKMLTDEIRFNVSSYRQALYFLHVYVNDIEKEIHRLVIIH